MINEKPPHVGAAKNRLVSVITRELEAARNTSSPIGPRSSTWANGSISQYPSRRRLSPKGQLPWKLSTFVDDGPVFKVFVRQGMVNNLIPTIDVSGTQVSLSTIPAPALVVTGALGVVYIKATVDGAGSTTALEVLNGTAIPTDTISLKYRRIGSWAITNNVFTSNFNNLTANQSLYICNRTAIWGVA